MILEQDFVMLMCMLMCDVARVKLHSQYCLTILHVHLALSSCLRCLCYLGQALIPAKRWHARHWRTSALPCMPQSPA